MNNNASIKRISVYTRDGEVASSSYYRILQYFRKEFYPNIRIRQFIPKKLTQAQYNAGKGIKGLIIKFLYHFCVYFCSIVSFIKDIINKPDVIIILRGITPKTFFFPASTLYKIMVSKCKKVIWDFDDDIFLNNEISTGERFMLEKNATNIVVTHDRLKNLLSSNIRSKVIELPTTDGDFRAIDKEQLNIKRKESYRNEFKIVWVASSSGLKDIEMIADELDNAAKRVSDLLNKRLKLIVVCNKPFLYQFKYINIENITWTRQCAIQYISEAHIGVMPLQNTQFALGKGGFKIVQYMAAGLPSIASSVGFNNSIIEDGVTGYLINNDNEYSKMWIEKIFNLASNFELWEKMSFDSYQNWLERFDYNTTFQTFKCLVNE